MVHNLFITAPQRVLQLPVPPGQGEGTLPSSLDSLSLPSTPDTHKPSLPAQGTRSAKKDPERSGSIRWDRRTVLCGFPACVSPGRRATLSLTFASFWPVPSGLWSKTFSKQAYLLLLGPGQQAHSLTLVYSKAKSSWDSSRVHWLFQKRKRAWGM